MNMTSQPEEKPDGAPEWMVSFADMITIMMSFFVIMFALASSDAAKNKRNAKQQQAGVESPQNAKQQAAFDSLNYRFGPNYRPLAGLGVMLGISPARCRRPRQDQGPHRARERPRRRGQSPPQGTGADSSARPW